MQPPQSAQQVQLAHGQMECVTFTGPHLLVSGPPGTGKTFVLLARAKRLAEQAAGLGNRVLLITFNKPLAGYVREQLRLNGVGAQVDVYNYHSWAYRVLTRAGHLPQVVYGAARRTIVATALATYRASQQASNTTPATPLTRHMDWWEEEIDWVKGRAIAEWETYRTMERIGRGQGLREPARRIVWDVLRLYNQLLHDRDRCDFRDYSLRLLALGTPLPDHWRADHVLIDEAQDLHYADLQVLAHLARTSTTVVADRKQKIYQTGFTWRDLGFDITGGGRSRILSQSYRTTREIALLAASLQQHETLVRPGDPDYGAGPLPTREGPVPVVYGVRDRTHEAATIVRLLTHLTASTPTGTVGLLAYSRDMLDELGALLRRHHLPYELILDREGNVSTAGIKLTTFHSSKGLEFGDVVLVGLTEGVFPWQPTTARLPRTGNGAGDVTSSDDGPTDHEEALRTARRVLYVAMTRAKHRLYLLHGTPPSRFIAELEAPLYQHTAPEVEAVTPAAVPTPNGG